MKWPAILIAFVSMCSRFQTLKIPDLQLADKMKGATTIPEVTPFVIIGLKAT
jgi:hypothetical protein